MSAAITTPITIIITALMTIVIIATIIIGQSEGGFHKTLKAFLADLEGVFFLTRCLKAVFHHPEGGFYHMS